MPGGEMTLFDPLRLRELELKNRIGVSPMYEYSAKDGHPGPWHFVHLASRAAGGAGLVFTEATAVQAIGRTSPADTGIYHNNHIESWKPIVDFIRGRARAGHADCACGKKGEHGGSVAWRAEGDDR
jgi:2,4-dienoyl-CoA reductase-like NADH-dependent reductase (Old Yellow Enzyme family)